jgi:hypothetical protein
MGDYVLKNYPALERLVERASAQRKSPSFEESQWAVGDDGVHDEEVLGAFDSTPSALSSQFSVNAVRKKPRHKKQSRRQTKCSLRKAEHASRTDKSSKKATAANRRLEWSFHDHKSFFGPTIKLWRLMVTPGLSRVSSAQRRFAVSLGHSKAALLAAADELDAAARDATTWLTTHTCPDSNVGDEVAGFVKHVRRGRRTSRWSVASPLADTHESLRSLAERD